MVEPRQRSKDALKIAVIGDVHHHWDEHEEAALQHLGVDLVLLVGDFGNEAVDLVQAIAAMNIPKAVILGNHDAWYTASDWGRKQCPYDRRKEDRVQQQLDILGATHVGYSHLDFPEFNLSVVGSRPFSWGGAVWKNAGFYQTRFQVKNFAESTDRIVQAAQQATCDTLIFLAHTGPTGLGDRPEDPCGKDWEPLGGDYGDPDLEAAITQVGALNKSIGLVAFGHMHHHLRHTRDRLRRSMHVGPTGLIYLNAALVPRLIQTPEGTRRNFTLVDLQGGAVRRVASVWLNPNFSEHSQEILFDRESASALV